MPGFKIITQWEQGVVLRFGKALPGIRTPRLTWVNPFTDRLRKVNMQILVAVPAQEAITLVMPFPVELLRFFDSTPRRKAGPGRRPPVPRQQAARPRQPACRLSPGPAR